MAHIGIAGAGLLGRLLALQLAKTQNHRIEVFDVAPSAVVQRAAGWTAAGMLSPVAELEGADNGIFALGQRSLALWPAVAAELGVDFQQKGSWLVAHRTDAGTANRVVGVLSHKAPLDFAPQLVSPLDLRELEPALHNCPLAWLLPSEGQIDTTQAMRTMYDAAVRLGVFWHWGCSVVCASAGRLDVVNSSHPAQPSTTKIFDWVFDVRGVGAQQLDANMSTNATILQDANQMPRVRGVRGEIFTLHAPHLVLQRPVRLLHPRHRVYIVPRRNGQILVGASEIESTDLSAVSVRTTLELLSAAHSILPELAEARIVDSRVNLRPALPDNLPCVVQSEGITAINGLFRHGWLLAPALLEKVLKDLVL